MDHDDDIEDLALDMDEVNDCFERGIQTEGPGFLERMEKLVLSDHAMDKDEEKVIRAFDNINRKVSRGKEFQVLNEFEKFGFNSETLLRLGSIVVKSSPRTPKIETKRNQSDSSYDDNYDNDFEEYDSAEFEATDQKIKATPMYPTFTEEEPKRAIRSKTAPQKRGHDHSKPHVGGVSSMISPNASARASRFKTTSWISKGQWRLGEKIGSGAFGEVFQGMSDDGFLFAVKRLGIANNKEIVNLTSEIELMQSLSHPNIVKYLGAKVDEDLGVVYIFQEWVPGGSVAHLLKRFGPFSPGVVRTYTRQILLGLEYLHANGVVHRDIKGGNILVDDSGNVKLADFGASTTLSSFGETQETATIKGTPYFMAPEVLSESKYGRRGDIWAVGCTIIQMLSGDPPWKDRKLQTLIQLHMLLSTWEGIPPLEQDIPEDLRDFLELCFMKDPKKRPMATDLLQHEFLNLMEDDFGDSIGSGGTLDIREQLERAVTRASFRPEDTFGEIDRKLAAKGAAVAGPPERYRSESESTSESSSPAKGSGSSNPFSKKSTTSSAMAALAAPPVSSPSSDNPYAKGAPRASTANAAQQIVRRPSPRNATAPQIPVHPRRGSGSSQGSDEGSRSHRGANPTPAYARHASPRDGPAEESENTPRSTHTGVRMRSSASTSSIPPTHSQHKHTNHTPRSARSRHSDNDLEATTAVRAPQSGGPKWKCLNNKCGKWNEADDEFCFHCAFRKGATGERGALSPRSKDVVSDDEDYEQDGMWKCKNTKCGKLNINEDDFCMHCAVRKGATGARGAGAVLFSTER